MCAPTSVSGQPIKAPGKASRAIGWINSVLFPLHPIIAFVAFAYWVPSWCYLNRGFTVWFHLASILQVVTQSKFGAKVLAVSGISICMGWYASITFEFFFHGRFCDALYKNMPSVLVDEIVDPVTGAPDFESTNSLVAMLICHVLDFIGHPLLAYHFWRKSRTESNNALLEWPVMIASYCFSRTWSIVHNYHNYGKFGLFYFGFDVYIIDDLNVWYPAYIIESLFFASLVLYKLTQCAPKEKQT